MSKLPKSIPKVLALKSAYKLLYAQIAQLVEQRTENPRVVGSIPTLGIVNCDIAFHVQSTLETAMSSSIPTLGMKKNTRMQRVFFLCVSYSMFLRFIKK